jgi:GNAT superfamily N-acetyltransferase
MPTIMKPERQALMDATATKAREQRGTWFRMGSYPTLRGARLLVGRVHKGSATGFPGAGDWEAYSAPADDGQAVWVRYVAGDQPVPPLPEWMTVRVRYDGEGPGYSGVGVLTVTVAARCPRCGGPRGVDTVRPHRFVHDGDHLTVDRWTNACGHTDMYEDVVLESRRGEGAGPADMLQAAYAARDVGIHASQAANLLERRGYQDAAALVRGEVKNRRGHLSTLGAVQFLRDLAGGETR